MNTEEFIEKFQDADVKSLALKGTKYPEVDLPFALDQIAGRQTARLKLPSYATLTSLHYPHHLSMEQCSSEQTAREKARLVASSPDLNSFVDLTAGFGIDFRFLAPFFKQAIYIEQQEYLCRLAQHNFPILGLSNSKILNTDSLNYLEQMEPVDWIFLDPARRDKNGGKVVRIQDCEPDVAALEPLLLQKAKHVLIKLSPMLDISLAIHTLSHVQEILITAVSNECKELVFLLGRNPIPEEEIQIHTVNLQKEEQRFSFKRYEELNNVCSYANQVETFLYEPNVALLKAGAQSCLTQTFQIQKLHPNSQLYTSTECQKDFPGRIFQVVKICGFSKKELKELQALKQANLAVRNFPQSVADLRKRLKLTEGGTQYLFATTLNAGEKVLIWCQKLIKN